MNEWNRWRTYPASKPLAVEGGLKARTGRGAIGSSWWSRRFLDVLESFAMGNRLTRGRAYARKGQVISLDVLPGEVRSLVQGSRVQPYRVTISLSPFSDPVWANAEIALSEQALPSAKLLAGEVPPELEEIFASAGAPLFPQKARDLTQKCNCPDSQVPCKHLAATFYLLAEAFDADPFLVLRWRGRDRETLLNRLRELRLGPAGSSSAFAPTSSRAAADEGAGSGSGSAQATAGAALALDGLGEAAFEPERFWLAAPLSPRPPVLEVDPALLLRQLPEPGAALGGQALLRRMRSAYEQFGAAQE